jgi:hypothetical protein
MSENKKSQNSNEGKGGNQKLIIIIGLIIIILLLIIIIVLLLKKNPGASDVENGEQTGGREVVAGTARMVLDEETAGSVYEEMRREVEEGMFECCMSMTWTFKDGNSESKDAYVANSVNNSHPFYFDVCLEDSEEILYSSPILPVGTQLTDIKLDTSLPAGTYRAVCKYTLLKDEVSQEEISSAGFIISIVVQN